MLRQGRQALDDREVSLPPEDGLEDSRGNCDQLEGRMVLGRLERIDAIKPRATGYAARRQMRTLVRSFLPVDGLPFSGPPKHHSALELLAVLLGGPRTTRAALGAAGGLPVA
jgi:hypothetical protein